MSKKIDIYQIESNIPAPKKVKALPPIRQLEVGESILFPNSKRNTVQSYASKVKRDTGRKFKIQKQDDKSARIWRVE